MKAGKGRWVAGGDKGESRPPSGGHLAILSLLNGPFQRISLLDIRARGRQAADSRVLEEMKIEVLTGTLAPHQPPAGLG